MNVFDLVAGLTLDDSKYMRSLDNADKKGVSKLSKGLKLFGKASAVAFGAATTVVGVLMKKSLTAYANFEQLEGGIRKLYGTGAKEMMKLANEAYKTSGMSANQYMETATSFSAAMIKSLNGDQKKAAQQTDVAMRAISDNYNTFGGDIEMIKNAYMGFARENYMMLDNLKLGYSGTKTGMEQLIKDANAYGKATGQASNLSIKNFSDVVTAIDLIQQKQGIAGTTAKEAATTIEGSTNMMKAAWGNLVTGIANDNVDFGKLIDNFVESVGIVGKNILPRIEQIFQGIGNLATSLIDKLLPPILQTITKNLPKLLTTVTDMVLSVVDAIISAAPAIIKVIPKIFTQFINIISKNAPALIKSIVDLIPTIIGGITTSLPTIINAIMNLMNTIVGELPTIIQSLVAAIPTIISFIVSALMQSAPVLAKGAVTLFETIVKVLPQVIKMLARELPQIIEVIVNGLVRALPVIQEAALNLLLSIVSAIPEVIVSIVQAMPQIISAIARSLIAAAPKILSASVSMFTFVGKALIKALGAGIKASVSLVVTAAAALVNRLKARLSSGWASISSSVSRAWAKIKERMLKPVQTAKEKIQTLIKKIKAFFPVNVGKIFSGWIPKITLKANKKKDSADTSSTVREEHFAKAMNQPYMFDTPTFFAAGEAGDEMLYGRKALMDDIAEATSGNAGNVYNFYNTITVDGADDPEEFANRLLRKLKIQARTV